MFIIGHLGGISRREIFPLTEDDRQADELQGFTDDTVVSNTIVAGKRDSVGIYPTTGGGGAESERISQGVILNANKPPVYKDVSCTLDTRCGALPSFNATYVIEKK